MKLRTIIFYLLILVGLISAGVSVTFAAMTNKNLLQVIVPAKPSVVEAVLSNPDHCSSREGIQGLGDASDLHIKKLTEYETLCKSFVTNRLMVFTDMPKDNNIATTNALSMVRTLREYAKYNITPIVIVEPTSKWGLIDFQEFNTGFYDYWIDTYFKTLKDSGITDDQMGIWVPFPEANIPTWNKGNATPNDFAKGVNKYLKILKKYFPTTHASILLNSATYDNTDYDWAYGEYISLLPYVSGIDSGLVDSFGLQGFPWMPSRNSPSNGLTDPSQYLNYVLAVEAAQKLGVKEIWFNTGTFSRKYTNDATQAIEVDYLIRKNILDRVIAEAQKVQSREFTVWINMFNEDKSDVTEATDWSYWHDLKVGNTMDQTVFKDFVADLGKYNIGLSIYDVVKK